MNEYTFTKDELISLAELYEDALSIDHKIKRRVGHIAETNGIDPTKNDIRYDIKKGKIFYEPAKELTKTD